MRRQDSPPQEDGSTVAPGRDEKTKRRARAHVESMRRSPARRWRTGEELTWTRMRLPGELAMAL